MPTKPTPTKPTPTPTPTPTTVNGSGGVTAVNTVITSFKNKPGIISIVGNLMINIKEQLIIPTNITIKFV